jgi:hypothetical protein
MWRWPPAPDVMGSGTPGYAELLEGLRCSRQLSNLFVGDGGVHDALLKVLVASRVDVLSRACVTRWVLVARVRRVIVRPRMGGE